MATKDYTITRGKTFQRRMRWEAPPYIYKPISAITQSAPVRITATGHGLLDGQSAAVVSVKGMVEINASKLPPDPNKDYERTTVIDPNTVEFNEVNSAGFKAYVSGGYLQYRTPVDMTGYTARMSVKDKIGGTLLVSLTTENGGITLDNVAKTITLLLTAVATAAFTWDKGVYDLEMVSPVGVVTELYSGKITVLGEVTT